MFSIHTRIYGEKNNNIVLVFAGWEIKKSYLFLLGQLLASYNFKAVIFTWDKELLTPDTALTLSRLNEIKEKVLLTVSQFPPKEQKHIAVFGLSEAGVMALMIAASLPSVNKLILNLSGGDISEIIWHKSRKKKELRAQLAKKHLTLPKLKAVWEPISPISTSDQLKAKHLLIYLAAKDEVIPFSEQEKLLYHLRKSDHEIEAIVNTRHNHEVSGIVNLLRFPIYIRFLRRLPKKHLRRQK